MKKEEKQPVLDKSLQLQAYERLTILAERLALKNLVSRINRGYDCSYLPGSAGRKYQTGI